MKRNFWPLAARGRMLAVTAISVAAIAVPAVAMASTSASGAPAIRRCSAAHTLVWFAANANATAGTVFYPIEFTNTGATCWMRGYPMVAAAGRNGNKVSPYASRNGMRPRTIVLRHNQTAHAMLGIVEPGNFSHCHVRGASALRVNPPNQHRKVIDTINYLVCTSRRSLNISPVRAGIGVPYPAALPAEAGLLSPRRRQPRLFAVCGHPRWTSGRPGLAERRAVPGRIRRVRPRRDEAREPDSGHVPVSRSLAIRKQNPSLWG